jgi:hypothetical protein
MLTVSTKCCRVNCIVKAVFPTPPSPSTTNLYSTILPAMMRDVTRTYGGCTEIQGTKWWSSQPKCDQFVVGVCTDRRRALICGGNSFGQEARTFVCGGTIAMGDSRVPKSGSRMRSKAALGCFSLLSGGNLLKIDWCAESQRKRSRLSGNNRRLKMLKLEGLLQVLVSQRPEPVQ